MNKKCVFTFIVGDYDNLKTPNIITPGWDYICVTDNPYIKSDGIWDIILISEEDKHIQPAKRRAMSLMIGHRKYLPKDYDIVITVGGQCIINIDLNELLDKYGYDSSYDACFLDHPNRNCVYDEGNTVIQVRRDTPENIRNHVDFLKQENYPSNNGLYASGMMIINNRSSNIHAYFDQWLSDYQKLPSVRDQMTMNYSEWKLNQNTGIKLNLKLLHFQNMFERDRDIFTVPHQKSHSEAIKTNKMKIFYRISDAGYKKEKPTYITNENCLKNFVRVFWHQRYDITVIADNCSQETLDMIGKYIDPINIHKVSVGHGAGTFNLALDIALKIEDPNTIVYFVENDYIHLKNSPIILNELHNTLNAPYGTLYLHPDKFIPQQFGGNPEVDFDGGYTTKIYRGPTELYGMFNSTTMTFSAKVGTLKEDEYILRKWTSEKHPNDFQMFLELRSKGKALLCPLNTYSTHAECKWLAPLYKISEQNLILEWEKHIYND